MDLAKIVAGGTPSNYMPQSPGHPSLGNQLRSPYPYGNPTQSPRNDANSLLRPPPPRQQQPGAFSGRSNHAQAANSWVHKRVRVLGGQYNGYRGTVKHQTGTHAQLELDAITNRVVTVELSRLRPESAAPGGPAGRPGPQDRYPPRDQRGGSQDYYGSQATRTPLHPSQTPLHPSMTPAHPSMTPMHAPYTPMHAPTPMDDNYHMLGGSHQQDMDRGHHHMTAPTPGGFNAYTPAYTPALTPSGNADHTAPTPGLDAGGYTGFWHSGYPTFTHHTTKQLEHVSVYAAVLDA